MFNLNKIKNYINNLPKVKKLGYNKHTGNEENCPLCHDILLKGRLNELNGIKNGVTKDTDKKYNKYLQDNELVFNSSESFNNVDNDTKTAFLNKSLTSRCKSSNNKEPAKFDINTSTKHIKNRHKKNFIKNRINDSNLREKKDFTLLYLQNKYLKKRKINNKILNLRNNFLYHGSTKNNSNDYVSYNNKSSNNHYLEYNNRTKNYTNFIDIHNFNLINSNNDNNNFPIIHKYFDY